MDLSQLDSTTQDTTEVVLLNNSAGDTEVSVKVVGMHSAEYREMDRQWRLSNVRKAAKRGRGLDGSTENGATELLDTVALREQIVCEACIKELNGLTANGEPVALSPEALKAIFKVRPAWRAKIVIAIESEQVFTRA